VEPRHLDYILSVYSLTAFQFLKIGKLREALEFIKNAEKVITMIIGY
jgi:hypothetical protein